MANEPHTAPRSVVGFAAFLPYAKTKPQSKLKFQALSEGSETETPKHRERKAQRKKQRKEKCDSAGCWLAFWDLALFMPPHFHFHTHASYTSATHSHRTQENAPTHERHEE